MNNRMNLTIILLIISNIIRYISSKDDASDDSKVFALYFPQFYSDKLNNKLWGENFTDWNNLLLAPKYNKNNQLIARPTELGFYNLLDYDIRKKQSELAKQYSVDGFIFHHYWFYQNDHNNEASLSKVIDSLLVDNQPDISFALNWAYDSWVTTWHSKYTTNFHNVDDVLVEQRLTNDPSLIKEHYNYLRQFFHHSNYCKVNGVPYFTIFGPNPQDMNIITILLQLRKYAIEDGFPEPGLHIPFLTRMRLHSLYTGTFPLPRIESEVSSLYEAVLYYPYNDSPQRQMAIPAMCRANIHSSVTQPSYVSVNSVFDNTPRRSVEAARIFDRQFPGQTITAPQSFHIDVLTALMFDSCCQSERARSNGAKIVTVNAWNEWGEGMMLEPSDKYGRELLEAVKNAKIKKKEIGCDWSQYDEYVAPLLPVVELSPEAAAAAEPRPPQPVILRDNSNLNGKDSSPSQQSSRKPLKPNDDNKESSSNGIVTSSSSSNDQGSTAPAADSSNSMASRVAVTEDDDGGRGDDYIATNRVFDRLMSPLYKNRHKNSYDGSDGSKGTDDDGIVGNDDGVEIAGAREVVSKAAAEEILAQKKYEELKRERDEQKKRSKSRKRRGHNIKPE